MDKIKKGFKNVEVASHAAAIYTETQCKYTIIKLNCQAI